MARKATFVCPLCAEAELRPERSIPRCRKCRIRMERCGDMREFSKIARMTLQDRLVLANSDEEIPRGR